jgi:N-acetylmuramoyl-L-alanine amidase
VANIAVGSQKFPTVPTGLEMTSTLSKRKPSKVWIIAGMTALLFCGGVAFAVLGDSYRESPQPVRSKPHRNHPRPTPAMSTTTIAPRQVLTGKVVTVDPGHNGGNFNDPSYIDQMIWNGREYETCNTTGTETDSGYTEAQFNWNVAQYLAADLRSEGATVVLTRDSNTGVGPCVNQRAAIANAAHSNAAIAIHADGGPADGRGFAILEPVADGINNAIVTTSQTLGADIRTTVLAGTQMPLSTYDGVNGIAPRDNLAGLNLSTVPMVLIECGNMRNATDAALLVSPPWQELMAQALAKGLTVFLTSAISP